MGSARALGRIRLRDHRRFDSGLAPRPEQADRALVDTQGLSPLSSGDRLRVGFVCGLASDDCKDVEREHAPESVHEGRRGVGGVFVEVDDRAR